VKLLSSVMAWRSILIRRSTAGHGFIFKSTTSSDELRYEVRTTTTQSVRKCLLHEGEPGSNLVFLFFHCNASSTAAAWRGRGFCFLSMVRPTSCRLAVGDFCFFLLLLLCVQRIPPFVLLLLLLLDFLRSQLIRFTIAFISPLRLEIANVSVPYMDIDLATWLGLLCFVPKRDFCLNE
jgi:hypothetical protein